MTSEFFGRQRECRFYTAGCGNKMAVSATGPRAVIELGGPVTPGIQLQCVVTIFSHIIFAMIQYNKIIIKNNYFLT